MIFPILEMSPPQNEIAHTKTIWNLKGDLGGEDVITHLHLKLQKEDSVFFSLGLNPLLFMGANEFLPQ